MKWFVLLALSQPAWAGEVIDLGKMEVRGKVRGPEVQLIDPSEMKEKSAQRLTQMQLSQLEKDLLQHQPPTLISKEGK